MFFLYSLFSSISRFFLLFTMSVILLEGNIGVGKSTFLRKILSNQCINNGRKFYPIVELVKTWTTGPLGYLLTAANNGTISQAVFQVNL